MIRKIVTRLPACTAAVLVVVALGACSAQPAAEPAVTAATAAPVPADTPAPPPPADPAAPGVDPCQHPSPPSYCTRN